MLRVLYDKITLSVKDWPLIQVVSPKETSLTPRQSRIFPSKADALFGGRSTRSLTLMRSSPAEGSGKIVREVKLSTATSEREDWRSLMSNLSLRTRMLN